MNDKIEVLSRVLEIDPGDIEIKKFNSAWYEVDLYHDKYNDEYYLILDNDEYYYNADLYGVDMMEEIYNEEYTIYRVT